MTGLCCVELVVRVIENQARVAGCSDQNAETMGATTKQRSAARIWPRNDAPGPQLVSTEKEVGRHYDATHPNV